MFKIIFIVLFGLVGMVNFCLAGDVSFGTPKTAVSGTDIQEFDVKDIDGDSKPDIIYRDSEGIKYSLQSSGIPTEGLVVYYPFNGNVNDESGNGNHGAENGGVSLTVDRHGTENSAYTFDGEDDYIVSPTNLNNYENVSISLWIYLNSWPDNPERFQVISNDCDTFGRVINIYDNTSSFDQGDIVLFHSSDWVRSSGKILSSDQNITMNQWYNMTAIWTESYSQLYLNGVKVLDGDGSISGLNDCTNLYISEPGNHSDYTHGEIDDIRIYNRVLSESEILALYNEGK